MPEELQILFQRSLPHVFPNTCGKDFYIVVSEQGESIDSLNYCSVYLAVVFRREEVLPLILAACCPIFSHHV